MKTRLVKHSDSSELSQYFTCVDAAQWADSVLSVHSIWDYTSHLWCSAFCLHTMCLVLARLFSSPSLPLPPSTIKCRGITYSHHVVPPQPCNLKQGALWMGNPLGDRAWATAGIPFSFPIWKVPLQYNSPSIKVRLNTVQALANCCSLDMLLLFVQTSLLHLLSFRHIINAVATWKAPACCTNSNVTSMMRFWKGVGASRRNEEFTISYVVSWWVALGVRRCQGLTRSWEEMRDFPEHRRLGKSSC